MTEQLQTPLQAEAPLSTKKAKAKKPSELDALKEKVDNLEQCLAHIATLSGQGNYLQNYGLTRVEPTAKEMRKY